ncbi:helix-turn-helix transcriptional regulator [Streptomyces radicis]|uniref:DNA-binding response regulator n=1 Tax=Streptomyces radicis TaxID=1750517 RepID=A0A3A9W6U3_9ACTN|nr:LuxR C-terminal-related transcriptional regulator [Streptomyces radicis]RKN08590.1 DNA-binding response regulator [Streptomyces radicis]RKN21748.1 DNA-binding response regulator [Streptomyces radicis]
MHRLAARDYENMLDLAAAVLRGDDTEPSWQPLLAELSRGLHAPTVVMTEASWIRQEGTARAWTPGPALTRARMDGISGRMIEAGHPFLRHYCTQLDTVPRTAADLMGGKRWLGSRTHGVTREAFGAEHILAVPLPGPPGVARGFIVYHERDDFAERERAYARRVQSLLAAIDAHRRHLARWRARVECPARADCPARGACSAHAHDNAPLRAASHAAKDAGLTPRELAVLTLLADSLPATAIGRRLGISHRTVHKHIQNIYRKLDVPDRLSAVLRAQSTGLLTALGHHA